MSALKCLLSSASRQYTCLVRNTFSVQRHVQSAGICMTRCLRTDDVNTADSTVENKVPIERTEPQYEAKKRVITLGEDYTPGGRYIPTTDVYEHLVDGVRYDELPRIYINATLQNTIASASVNGNGISSQSGGKVGFKHSRKKTNVCGQTVGLAVGMDLVKKGYKNACVILKGPGAGRLPAIKGVQIAGINIIAITDMTFRSTSSRPKKPRRL